jgi:ribA/ribD-fused uncharacterized protein
MKSIWFKAVAEKYGWMGNMAPYPITYEGKVWLTSEALFQGMRYDDEKIKEIIRKEKSPMAAKMKAKKFKDHLAVIPMSPQDVDNMKKCVKLKFDQYPQLKRELMNTKDAFIFEDIGNRNGERHKFWGAKKISENEGDGQNMMGRILMELRADYFNLSSGRE